MIDYRYKIKILGILDYYKLNMNSINNWRKEFENYSFQRNIFIECHGRFTKIKINKAGDLECITTLTRKEKEISNIYYMPKDGYKQYTLIGDDMKKELKKASVYEANRAGVFENFIDTYLNEIDADDFEILYLFK